MLMTQQKKLWGSNASFIIVRNSSYICLNMQGYKRLKRTEIHEIICLHLKILCVTNVKL